MPFGTNRTSCGWRDLIKCTSVMKMWRTRSLRSYADQSKGKAQIWSKPLVALMCLTMTNARAEHFVILRRFSCSCSSWSIFSSMNIHAIPIITNSTFYANSYLFSLRWLSKHFTSLAWNSKHQHQAVPSCSLLVWQLIELMNESMERTEGARDDVKQTTTPSAPLTWKRQMIG